MVGMKRRGQYEADLVLHEQVGSTVARASLGPAIRRQAESERRAVEMRRLPRVPHVKFDVISAVQRKEVLLNRRGMIQRLWHMLSSVLQRKGGCLRPSRWRCGGN